MAIANPDLSRLQQQDLEQKFLFFLLRDERLKQKHSNPTEASHLHKGKVQGNSVGIVLGIVQVQSNREKYRYPKPKGRRLLT